MKFAQQIKRGKEILEAYKQTGNMRQVGRMFNVSHSRIQQIISEFGYKKPLKKLTAEQRKQATVERKTKHFWSRIKKNCNSKGCWEWQGYRNTKSGYGHACWQGKSIGAHVLAHWLHTGIKPVLHVLHSCDNPPCCNPAHLREDTPAQNMKDRDERGRAAHLKNPELWKAKLLNGRRQYIEKARQRAVEIVSRYQAGESAISLAKAYGINRTSVHRILRSQR